MKRHQFIILSLLVIVLAAICVRPQMTDTFSDGCVQVVDVTNKRERCMAGNGMTIIYRAKGINLNAGANTDSGSTFTGLPSRYIVRRLTFDNASGTPTLSTVALRTAASGGGTALVTAQALSTLNATTVLVDSTLAVTTSIQTASILYIRNVAAAGSAMTCDSTLEVTPLN